MLDGSKEERSKTRMHIDRRADRSQAWNYRFIGKYFQSCLFLRETWRSLSVNFEREKYESLLLLSWAPSSIFERYSVKWNRILDDFDKKKKEIRNICVRNRKCESRIPSSFKLVRKLKIFCFFGNCFFSLMFEEYTDE